MYKLSNISTMHLINLINKSTNHPNQTNQTNRPVYKDMVVRLTANVSIIQINLEHSKIV